MVLSTSCTSSTGMLILRGPWPEPQRRKNLLGFQSAKFLYGTFMFVQRSFAALSELESRKLAHFPRQLGSFGLSLVLFAGCRLVADRGRCTFSFSFVVSLLLFFFFPPGVGLHHWGRRAETDGKAFYEQKLGRGDLGKRLGGATAWTSMRPLHDQFWGDNLFFLAACDLSPIFGFHNLDI